MDRERRSPDDGGVIAGDRPDAAAKAAIRAVLFDVGGVLSADMIETKLADLALRYGQGVFAGIEALRERADRGEIEDEDFWHGAIQAAGGTPVDGDADIHPYLVAVPGTLELVKRLRARGLRVGILSNDSRQMSRARRDKLGFDAIFDPIIISCHLGVTKPHGPIYAHAAAALGLPAAQILFIDNSPANVEGARRQGLEAILFENAGQLEVELIRLGLL